MQNEQEFVEELVKTLKVYRPDNITKEDNTEVFDWFVRNIFDPFKDTINMLNIEDYQESDSFKASNYIFNVFVERVLKTKRYDVLFVFLGRGLSAILDEDFNECVKFINEMLELVKKGEVTCLEELKEKVL